jgi:hypothetical protein
LTDSSLLDAGFCRWAAALFLAGGIAALAKDIDTLA